MFDQTTRNCSNSWQFSSRNWKTVDFVADSLLRDETRATISLALIRDDSRGRVAARAYFIFHKTSRFTFPLTIRVKTPRYFLSGVPPVFACDLTCGETIDRTRCVCYITDRPARACVCRPSSKIFHFQEFHYPILLTACVRPTRVSATFYFSPLSTSPGLYRNRGAVRINQASAKVSSFTIIRFARIWGIRLTPRFKIRISEMSFRCK